MLHRLALVLTVVAAVLSPRELCAQDVPSLAAGQAIPLGRRVFVTQDVSYRIEGTTASLRVGGIMQRHLAGGGWSASATLSVTDGSARTELAVGVNASAPQTRVSSGGLSFTVFVIHHTGGIELAIARTGASASPSPRRTPNHH